MRRIKLTDRQKYRQTELQTDRRTDGQMDILTERHTDRRKVGQTNRETDRWRNLQIIHAGREDIQAYLAFEKSGGGDNPPPPIFKRVKGRTTIGYDLLRHLSVGISFFPYVSNLLQHMSHGKVTWLLHVYAYVLQTYMYILYTTEEVCEVCCLHIRSMQAATIKETVSQDE